MMFGNKKSAQEKALEKERKKYGTRKYGQTVLKHSRMGIWSCWYAAGAFLLLVAAILAAFILRGQTVGFVGGMGVLAVILAGMGIRASVKGRPVSYTHLLALLQRDTNVNFYLTLVIAVVVSVLCGLLNGIIVHEFRVPAMIATLGTQTIIYGIVKIISGALTVSGLDQRLSLIHI